VDTVVPQSTAVDTVVPKADRLKTTKLTQCIHTGTGIVSAGRIEYKAKGACTLRSITKYKNVAIDVSVRNGGIGHVEQKRLWRLNGGQVRFFPDEDHKDVLRGQN
jgi:hypothetical protein